MKLTPEKLTAFCAALAETCNVGKACKAVDISRVTAYKWRDEIPAFAEAWDKAMKIGITALEDEAHRRAFEGYDKPIVHQGVVMNTCKEYSDTLAIFLLKAHAPDKYRENSRIELDAKVDVAQALMAARKRVSPAPDTVAASRAHYGDDIDDLV